MPPSCTFTSVPTHTPISYLHLCPLYSYSNLIPPPLSPLIPQSHASTHTPSQPHTTASISPSHATYNHPRPLPLAPLPPCPHPCPHPLLPYLPALTPALTPAVTL
ncbi:hypothetical protein Pmani_004211 [Petrolisthes manimaculis]|uniref:Uncharacterized protein n=1 Tax=Petrolisthes manimaculis TaxID=1843537 RepID=A0AAE1ULR6_9EUCA|nr:hypothetical protein Pmani_004211 [Petrolisthes manimaculis]